MSFVHLHRHSEFSLLDGVGSAQLYAERAAELGQPALALTDHGVLTGSLYHVEACAEVGIKPILGMEGYFRHDIEKDRAEKNVRNYYHLVLLAMNEEGWNNLMRISTASHRPDRFYMKPCIDWTLLEKHHQGLIATSSCLAGYAPQMMLQENHEEADRYIARMQQLFGDRYYMEIQPHAEPEQVQANLAVVNSALALGVGLVATGDVHYPHPDWRDTQKVSSVLGKKKTKEEEDGEEKSYLSENTFAWLTSDDELANLFMAHHSTLPADYVMEALSNTVEVANRVEVVSFDKSPKIPKATQSLFEAERILRQWCREGLERIGKQGDPVYEERVNTELALMRKLKVLDYFVIIGDMVRWAKEQGIRVGPGRGSAGGSLICYLTRITAMDPIGYGLLFERFLNEDRIELPDIDIDFQHDRREEVKSYLLAKYGEDKVVDVAAFDSFGFKSSIQRVAHALDVSYPEVMRATNDIPDPSKTFGMDFDDIENTVPAIKAFFEKYPEVKKHAVRLHGQMRGQSKHPAAVIVTDRPAEELLPMMRSKDGGMVTQWSERANAQLISPYGFLKIDMLVTASLTTQSIALAHIKKRHGIDVDFEDPTQFPVVESPLLSEEVVVKKFKEGRNIGVFQFASTGMLDLLRQIDPDTLDHIIAANALFRPGTLVNGMAFEYAKRKNGKYWSLAHESLIPLLGPTFGIIAFQEQVMQVARALGDFDPTASAVFLKIVAKGIARDVEGKKKMQTHYAKFREGARKKKVPDSVIDEIWQAILQMSTYAFNRSHAAGYALQGYQDQWLKTYYPIEEYAALLTIETEKVAQIVREAKHIGVHLLPPDVNKSGLDFTIDGNSIRFGLLAIKYLGETGVEEILANQPFASYEEFCDKIAAKKVNARAKKALVACGAFDTLGGRKDMNEEEKAAGEKEFLGFAISLRPDIDRYGKVLEKFVDPVEQLAAVQTEHGSVQVAGEITKVKEIKTKHSEKMAFADLDLNGALYQVTFFPHEFQMYRHMLAEGGSIAVSGEYDDERNCIVCSYCCTVEKLAQEA